MREQDRSNNPSRFAADEAATAPFIDVLGSNLPPLTQDALTFPRISEQFLEWKHGGMIAERAVLKHWQQGVESLLALSDRLPLTAESGARIAGRMATLISEVIAANPKSVSGDTIQSAFFAALGPSHSPGSEDPATPTVPAQTALDRQLVHTAFFRLSHFAFLQQSEQLLTIRATFEMRCLAILAATGLSTGTMDPLVRALERPQEPAMFTKALSITRDVAAQSSRILELRDALSSDRLEALIGLRKSIIGALTLTLERASLSAEAQDSAFDALIEFGSHAAPAFDYLLESPQVSKGLRQRCLINKLAIRVQEELNKAIRAKS